jgi:hypothetical protein
MKEIKGGREVGEEQSSLRTTQHCGTLGIIRKRFKP